MSLLKFVTLVLQCPNSVVQVGCIHHAVTSTLSNSGRFDRATNLIVWSRVHSSGNCIRPINLRFDRATNTESGDYCAYNFGTDGVVYFAPPHHYWPQSNVQIGSRSYLLQLTFNPVTGGCAKAAVSTIALTTSSSTDVTLRRQQDQVCSAGFQMTNNTCTPVRE